MVSTTFCKIFFYAKKTWEKKLCVFWNVEMHLTVMYISFKQTISYDLLFILKFYIIIAFMFGFCKLLRKYTLGLFIIYVHQKRGEGEHSEIGWIRWEGERFFCEAKLLDSVTKKSHSTDKQSQTFTKKIIKITKKNIVYRIFSSTT